MLARCPSCRNTFSTERAGRQDCPACGKPLVVPEAPAAQPPAAQPSGTPLAGLSSGQQQQPAAALPPLGGLAASPEQERPGTPWERRAELGLVQGWWQTMVQALFEPSRLFSAARLDRGSAQLGFALLTGSLFWSLGQLLDRFLLGAQRAQMLQLLQRMNENLPPWIQKMVQGANDNSPGKALLATLASPLFVLVFVYLNAGVTHLAALLLGQNKRGFAATFAATTYALAPMVLLAIPLCGGPIALIWIPVLTGVGLKHTHATTTGGAVAVTLAPYALCCGALCALSLLAATVLSRVVGGLPQ